MVSAKYSELCRVLGWGTSFVYSQCTPLQLGARSRKWYPRIVLSFPFPFRREWGHQSVSSKQLGLLSPPLPSSMSLNPRCFPFVDLSSSRLLAVLAHRLGTWLKALSRGWPIPGAFESGKVACGASEKLSWRRSCQKKCCEESSESQITLHCYSLFRMNHSHLTCQRRYSTSHAICCICWSKRFHLECPGCILSITNIYRDIETTQFPSQPLFR